MKTLLIVTVALLATTAAEVDDCYNKDSISCLQLELFRKAKSILDQDSIELFGGLQLVKNPGSKRDGRALAQENEVLSAPDVEKREEALEKFAVTGLSGLLQERSLQWNLSPLVSDVSQTVKNAVAAIPQEIKDGVVSFFRDEEGRGKKKKLLKALLPLLLGLKMKMAGFMVLSYFVIALIAKKALLASLASLAIAGFIAIKKLMSQGHHGHEVHEVSHGWSGGFGGGYSGGGGGGGWDSYGGGHDAHGAYSNNVAHSIAYSAQKPAHS